MSDAMIDAYRDQIESARIHRVTFDAKRPMLTSNAKFKLTRSEAYILASNIVDDAAVHVRSELNKFLEKQKLELAWQLCPEKKREEIMKYHYEEIKTSKLDLA